MKKVLMSKFEEKIPPSPPAPAAPSSPVSTSVLTSEIAKLAAIREPSLEKERKVSFQPPLPIGPPPPDSSDIEREIKKELIDDGYLSHHDDSNSNEYNETHNNVDTKPDDQRPMCKRFARGTCTKGSACIYRHELDLKQLHGIYKFCWDFQNKVCERPNCRHVHATVFEEQNFYRTGYLPPSTLAHQKPENDLQPPQTAVAAKDNSNTLQLSPQQGTSHVLSNPTPVCNNYNNNPVQPNRSPKTTWSAHSSSSSDQSERASSEPPSKKCKKCDLNEFRVELSNNKLEELMRSIVRLKEDTSLISEKNLRLHKVLLLLVQRPESLNQLLNMNLQIQAVSNSPSDIEKRQSRAWSILDM